jgi:FMN phosphatase YigB (HAD superfamily)
MVHVLSRETGLDENAITQDFKEVFAEHGSVEYAFSVQELRLCKGMSHSQVANLVRLAKGAFSRVREKNLHVYPGVKETLQWARQEAIAVVGVTNSPIFQARMRLRQLYVDHLFTGIAGWEGFDIPQEDPWAEPVKVRETGKGWPTKLEREWKFPEETLKPSPEMYRAILSDLGVNPDSAWIVGDSLHKDVKPALELGAIGVWAKYGQRFDQKNFNTLLAITNWSERRIADTYAENAVEPSLEIESFSELQAHIPSFQGSLFKLSQG